MKGEKYISTPHEIIIASRLSKNKALIFLESRFYIRQALSEVFKLNPLKIPIEAYPGRVPKLPPKMGYVSISHCHDAFLIAWHNEKIGIDIERSDRKFNYKALAKKYLIKNNHPQELTKITRKLVLKQWGEIEAAIKWDEGKLAKDLREWEHEKSGKYLIHKTKQIKLTINHYYFLDWSIALAYKNIKDIYFTNIICSNIKNFE